MAKRIKFPVAAWLACAGALVGLAVLAYKAAPIERLDASILVHLSAQPGTGTYALAEGFAHLADPVPLIAMLLAVCALAVGLGRRREAVAALAVVAGANLTTQILKVVLAHPRFQPFESFRTPWPTAFPSGHATAAASIAVALMLIAPPRLRPLAIAAAASLAVAVGTSVVVLEWHYPSDVLGGFLVAAGWGFAALAGLRLKALLRSSPPLRTRSASPSP